MTIIVSAGEPSPASTRRSSECDINHSRSASERSENAGTLRISAISASMRALSGISVMRFAAFPDAPRAVWRCSLDFSQILVHELNDHSAFADSRGYALHRTVAHVAYYENSRHIRFEQPGIAIQRPAFRPLAVA